ncbi:MAG: biotin--[Clostridia bacterium]|nr:biotin--[acetyl-CoA-carboxylase] ligase [Clostridia bacterium]MBR0445467.1 biotin--[acetyl-CoA-carboxylase] ligase [Clostridia bacterium]
MELDQQALYHISSDSILTRLKPDIPDLNVFCFDTVDSTNDEAKRRFRTGLKNTSLFVSDTQTNGRGRRGRSFYSPSATGIYLSLLYPLTEGQSGFLSFTSKAAVAVCRALNSVYSVSPKIKWVNDILLDGKKIAGILCEYVTDTESGGSAVVIGIGINLSTEIFPEAISDTAGSVGNRSVPREIITAAVAKELIMLLNDSGSSYLDEYRALSLVIGRHIAYERNGQVFTGKAVSIDSDAALVVLRDDGRTDVLNTGEITVRTA